MLEFALAHRNTIDAFTADQKNKVRSFELSDDEWTLLESLCKVLKVLKHATVYFSLESCLLSDVIPAMDKIDEMLTTQLVGSGDDAILCDKVKTALLLACRTLNKYYARTDDTDTYRIVMVLDPNKKLEYFRQADWPSEWIDNAKAATRRVFDASYRDRTDLMSAENTASTPSQMPATRTAVRSFSSI
ncbi:hypothetical protein CYLTODRAFT_363236 [Cylindrobasidium torrendii FP15055 ss-10]|uniref:hAT-like transposase RNase-H fold domain-containing protein n=1 Tax=Cylindrobasidium torrendii FP15055 ss-10 TaxID=1314674 RepID=A0A0D7ATI7_9AGAR|nr:hypothetical protein CYLTODRAFT_363236 [Cylindrobasidium torrendii FP15055 ss-10]